MRGTASRLPRDVGGIAVLRMGDGNARHHLRPICTAMAPGTVVIIRPSPQDARAYGPNAVTVDTSSRWRVAEVVWTGLVAFWLTIRLRPQRLFSFNGMPYGIITTWIGVLTGTWVHVGFVGTEVSKVVRRPWQLHLFGRIDLATTTGTAMTGMLVEHGLGTRVEILEHGVDAARFHVDESVERDIAVVFVGALIPRKRVDFLLATIARVRDDLPDVSMVVVGSGPEEARLRAVSAELGLEDCVTFAGHDPRPESWLQRAQLLLMASHWEGLPFVVVEAMRCGAVPVTNDIGTVTDLVNDGENGVVVSTDPSVDEVAHALRRLLTDDEQLATMRTAALQAVEHLTYDSIAHWWSDILSTPVP